MNASGAGGALAPTDDASLLRASLEKVADREPELVRRVYATLFRDHPEAEELFGRYGEERQAEMFGETLTSVLDLLDHEPWTPGHVAAMGHRHREAYGVPDEMYMWFSEAIVRALHDVLGERWDADTEAAFRRGLQRVNALMTGHAPST
ncbi:MAG: globin [Polyangiales bacterium]|nr:globin [Sandaracinaceae bacterium]